MDSIGSLLRLVVLILEALLWILETFYGGPKL
jgi:hypothetical protein